MEVFWLAPGLAAAIVDHAREGYPLEVCGLIAGRGRLGLEIYRARNVAMDPQTRFEIDPETLARQVVFPDQGLELSALYHSHPHGPAVPSVTDRAGAFYPDVVYLVCSLEGPEPVLRGFRIAGEQMWEVRLREQFDKRATIS